MTIIAPKSNVGTAKLIPEIEVFGIFCAFLTSFFTFLFTSLYELSSKRNEDVKAMKKELAKHIPKAEVDKIDENTKLLMLVTCKTPDDNTARRILFAKLKEK